MLWTGRTEFTRHASAFYASAVFWRNLLAGCGGDGFTIESGYVETSAVPLFRFFHFDSRQPYLMQAPSVSSSLPAVLYLLAGRLLGGLPLLTVSL